MIDILAIFISLYLFFVLLFLILSLLIGLKFIFLRTEFDRLIDRDILFMLIVITISLIYIAYNYLVNITKILFIT